MKSSIFKIPFLLLLASASISSFALRSPFASTVEGLSVPNSHVLANSENGGLLIRGMAPNKTQYDELLNLGVDSVLIFKNESRKELSGPKGEFKHLEEKNLSFLHIPFGWKDLDFEESCEQMVEGLSFLLKELDSGRTVFFHCTVGEDRTGALAALYRVHSEGWSWQRAFDEEMCGHGYAEGNPQKPKFVVGKIHQSLTPLYYLMAQSLKQGEKLSNDLCSGISQREIPSEIYKLRCAPQVLADR